MQSTNYDVVGIGIGPSNLGLAALADGANEDIDALFLEQKPEFRWHEDMLVEGAALMNSILGDLVTPVDPTNEYSFLNYLQSQDRFWEFYNYESFNIPRKEYDKYCRWAADRIESCTFNRRVESVTETNSDEFLIEARDPDSEETFQYTASNIVLGVGTRPHVPEPLSGHPENDVFHSSQYLSRRDRCLDADSITVIGSGQSSAEIFLDLLQKQKSSDYRVDWLTRSDGFYPVDPSKMTREMRTPDYIEYFYDLPTDVSENRVGQQDLLYKGISPATNAAIYDTLYRRSVDDEPNTGMLSKTDVQGIEQSADDRYRLDCYQWEEEKRFWTESEVIVLATGYRRPTPSFLSPITDDIEFIEEDTFKIAEDFALETNDFDGDIFIHNGGMHAHGFNTADLSVGAYQSATIINSILGREEYSVHQGSRFQSFGTEQFIADAPASGLVKDESESHTISPTK